MDHSTLSDEWSIVTGGSFIVHISAVHSKRDAGRYVSKYVSKPSEMTGIPLSRTVELASALAGRRTLITFGTAHNSGLPVRDKGDDQKHSRHVISLHIVIRAYKQSVPAALDFVALAAVHLPTVARLIIGGQPSGLPPPDVPEVVAQQRMMDCLASINWWSDHPDWPMTNDPVKVDTRSSHPTLFDTYAVASASLA